jgi:hypothetical protein
MPQVFTFNNTLVQFCGDKVKMSDIFTPQTYGDDKHVLFVLYDNIWGDYDVNTYYYFTGNGYILDEIIQMMNHYDRSHDTPHLFDTVYNIDAYKNFWKIYTYESEETMFSHLTSLVINDRLISPKRRNEGNRVNIQDMLTFHPLYPVIFENINNETDLLRIAGDSGFAEKNKTLVDFIYFKMRVFYTKNMYYEIIEKALHPNRVGKWLEAHLANGGDFDYFEY